MSSYLYDVNSSATSACINKADFPFLLSDIKSELLNNDKWINFGWRDNVLNAETLDDVSREFNINLEWVYGNYFKPIFNDTYYSLFFKTLAKIVEKYMTNGNIFLINDEDPSHIITITYACGKGSIEWEDRLSHWLSLLSK